MYRTSRTGRRHKSADGSPPASRPRAARCNAPFDGRWPPHQPPAAPVQRRRVPRSSSPGRTGKTAACAPAKPRDRAQRQRAPKQYVTEILTGHQHAIWLQMVQRLLEKRRLLFGCASDVQAHDGRSQIALAGGHHVTFVPAPRQFARPDQIASRGPAARRIV